MNTLGERIAWACHKIGLMQKEAAVKADISPATLSQYVKNKRKPDPETLAKIAKVCNVSTDFLIGLTDDPTPISSKGENLNLMDIVKDKEKRLHIDGVPIPDEHMEFLEDYLETIKKRVIKKLEKKK